MGEQITPNAVGKEVGVRADLRRGCPKPREIAPQAKSGSRGKNNDGKLHLGEQEHGRD